MKKVICYLLLIVILGSIPLAGIAVVAAETPDCYSDSYARVFEVQFNYLKSIDEPKIVIVGTSSSLFGLNIDTIKEEMNMPVVVLGNYGALGNTVVLDIVDNYIHKDDIVIYMYDIYPASMHIGFSAKIALQCMFNNYEIFSQMSFEHQCKILAYLPKYVSDNVTKSRAGADSYKTSGVWSKSEGYDEHGNMIVNLPNNIMTYGVKTSQYYHLKAAMIDSQFTSYVSDWAEKLRKKGATTYYHYAPMNEFGKGNDCLDEDVSAFAERWEKEIGMEVINDINDSFVDYRYCYNENAHLNSSGRVYYTSYMIRNIEIARFGYSNYEIQRPEPPTAECDKFLDDL